VGRSSCLRASDQPRDRHRARGRNRPAVEKLPISLLRLSEKIVGDLRTLGFKSIGELANTPRAPLTLRFGPKVGRRLDQMFGRMPEPIDPIRTPELISLSRRSMAPARLSAQAPQNLPAMSHG
jgi:protein ImuB